MRMSSQWIVGILMSTNIKAAPVETIHCSCFIMCSKALVRLTTLFSESSETYYNTLEKEEENFAT
ncbi:uncharacterized protein PHALS_00987 [Plasmopara halstedii]|uniref:RxLR-like protein n=1 Tax=Plasmopara halstedii TaxID=4781 RepID=A0A0P1AS87_PLAHL|nr:uncharacterized protein PHALS_00987 [Plasmopara halstedii]CEG44641.1 hypothetical protein PHALS_00987 [Plasmopara halstedii]|eukprot:XP_024581010.1 hypothetical protein PHALS_00987 [Plasmopara halstedii]